MDTKRKKQYMQDGQLDRPKDVSNRVDFMTLQGLAKTYDISLIAGIVAAKAQSDLSHTISLTEIPPPRQGGVFVNAVQTNTKTTSTEYFYYKDVIENSQETSENYSIEGVCSKRKVNNRNILHFNGTGFRKKTTNDLDGNKIEITYTVYSKMQGELCKNGNIKITLDEENGSASKAIVNGKEIDSSSSYSSESNFCLKNQ
jgi:hypothetical protein